MAKRKLTTATKDGNRAEQLQILAAMLAEAIQSCTGEKTLAPLAKQYRETIKELEEIGGRKDDDELSDILAQRQNSGKPGAVR